MSSKYLESDEKGNFVFRTSGTEWVPTLFALFACICWFFPCVCIPMLFAATYFQSTQVYLDEQKRKLQIFSVGILWRKVLKETVNYEDVVDFESKANPQVKINDQNASDLVLVTRSGARLVLGTDVTMVQLERVAEMKQHFAQV